MSPSGDAPPSNGAASPTRSDSALLAAADVGVVRFGPAGEIVGANDAFLELAQYERDELLGRSVTVFLGTVPSSLDALLSTDRPGSASATLTLPVKTASGETVAVESHFTRVDGDAETADEIVGVLYERADASAWATDGRDRSTGRDGETAPAKAFVALADALPDGIIVLDAASRIQYANPAVERILGYGPDELVGGSKLSIIPDRLQEAHLDALTRYLETGTRNIDWEYVELPGQHRDGHEVPLGISLNEFTFTGDRYFVGLFRDISPRKEAERALFERENRLSNHKKYTNEILNAVDDMFYVLDGDGNFQRWNRTFCEVSGYTDGDVSSMNVLEFFRETDRETVRSAIEEGFKTGSTRFEVPLVTEGGETIPYEFVAAALEDPAGNPVLAGIGRDITKRTKQRRELEESERRYRTLVEHFPNGLVALVDDDLRYTATGGSCWTNSVTIRRRWSIRERATTTRARSPRRSRASSGARSTGKPGRSNSSTSIATCRRTPSPSRTTPARSSGPC